jgi:hypothetical protein
MIYTELDLNTEERNAWQAGDYARAQALALAIDKSAEEAEMEDKIWELEAEKTNLLVDLGQVLAELRDLLDNANRVSNREAIMAKLDEAVKLT